MSGYYPTRPFVKSNEEHRLILTPSGCGPISQRAVFIEFPHDMTKAEIARLIEWLKIVCDKDWGKQDCPTTDYSVGMG